MDKRIQQDIDIPVTIADDPLTAVARGTGFMLDNIELMKQILETAEDV
jgi:rod shape-determining protein MreB